MYGIPIIAAGIVSLLIGFASGWKIQDWRFTSKIATIQAEHSKVMAEMADSARAAEATYRQIEANTRAIADEEREKNREKVAAINRDLANALEQLRKRPERRAAASSKVPSTAETCAGVSGAELARGDAGFLVGYGADAAKQREALRTCESQYDKVRAELLKE